MTDKVQKIREEVERLHNLLSVMDGDNISVNYTDRICTTLEMYIDSLQEEPVSKQKLSNVERTGKNWKEPVSEELEEAASSFARKDSEGISNPANFYYTVADKARIFKAGAEWQKKQDQSTIELAEDHAMLAGMEKMKEEMMAKAINTEASLTMSVPSICISLPLGVNVGDKVKVIVIKED